MWPNIKIDHQNATRNRFLYNEREREREEKERGRDRERKDKKEKEIRRESMRESDRQ